MKPFTAAAIVTAAASAGGWHFLARTPVAAPTAVSAGPAPARTLTDPVQVFQRAFWTRPSPEDRILHALREEWDDGGRMQRLRWFLAVEPSAALVARLHSENAFGLVRSSAKQPDGAPPWFRCDAAEAWQSASGDMRLYFTVGDRRLYATGTGRGFTEGAPAPAPPAAAVTTAARRLPNTSPPARP